VCEGRWALTTASTSMTSAPGVVRVVLLGRVRVAGRADDGTGLDDVGADVVGVMMSGLLGR
jgi:hypothetical protein